MGKTWWLMVMLAVAGRTVVKSLPSSEATVTVSIDMTKHVGFTGDKFLGLSVTPDQLKTTNYSETTLNMLQGLSPAYLRVCGIENETLNASTPEKSSAVFNESVWEEVNQLAIDSGMTLIASLKTGFQEDNILDLLQFLDKRGYNPIWQLEMPKANSLTGAEVGRAVVRLRKTMDLFPHYQTTAVLGPDVAVCGTCGYLPFLRDFLLRTSDIISVIPLSMKLEVDQEEDKVTHTRVSELVEAVDRKISGKDSQIGRDKDLPKKTLWIVETGEEGYTGEFSDALDWALRLGNAARHGYEVVLQHPMQLAQPTSDYWVSLLYRNLVGRAVLTTRLMSLPLGSAVTVFAHCTAYYEQPTHSVLASEWEYEPGAVTVWGVNSADKSAQVVLHTHTRPGVMHVYSLTADEAQSGNTLLNGKPLHLNHGALPKLSPQLRPTGPLLVVSVPARSMFYIVLPGARAPACLPHTATPKTAEPSKTYKTDTQTFIDIPFPTNIEDPFFSESQKEQAGYILEKGGLYENSESYLDSLRTKNLARNGIKETTRNNGSPLVEGLEGTRFKRSEDVKDILKLKGPETDPMSPFFRRLNELRRNTAFRFLNKPKFDSHSEENQYSLFQPSVINETELTKLIKNENSDSFHYMPGEFFKTLGVLSLNFNDSSRGNNHNTIASIIKETLERKESERRLKVTEALDGKEEEGMIVNTPLNTKNKKEDSKSNHKCSEDSRKHLLKFGENFDDIDDLMKCHPNKSEIDADQLPVLNFERKVNESTNKEIKNKLFMSKLHLSSKEDPSTVELSVDRVKRKINNLKGEEDGNSLKYTLEGLQDLDNSTGGSDIPDLPILLKELTEEGEQLLRSFEHDYSKDTQYSSDDPARMLSQTRVYPVQKNKTGYTEASVNALDKITSDYNTFSGNSSQDDETGNPERAYQPRYITNSTTFYNKNHTNDVTLTLPEKEITTENILKKQLITPDRSEEMSQRKSPLPVIPVTIQGFSSLTEEDPTYKDISSKQLFTQNISEGNNPGKPRLPVKVTHEIYNNEKTTDSSSSGILPKNILEESDKTTESNMDSKMNLELPLLSTNISDIDSLKTLKQNYSEEVEKTKSKGSRNIIFVNSQEINKTYPATNYDPQRSLALKKLRGPNPTSDKGFTEISTSNPLNSKKTTLALKTNEQDTLLSNFPPNLGTQPTPRPILAPPISFDAGQPKNVDVMDGKIKVSESLPHLTGLLENQSSLDLLLTTRHRARLEAFKERLEKAKKRMLNMINPKIITTVTPNKQLFKREIQQQRDKNNLKTHIIMLNQLEQNAPNSLKYKATLKSLENTLLDSPSAINVVERVIKQRSVGNEEDNSNRFSMSKSPLNSDSTYETQEDSLQENNHKERPLSPESKMPTYLSPINKWIIPLTNYTENIVLNNQRFPVKLYGILSDKWVQQNSNGESRDVRVSRSIHYPCVKDGFFSDEDEGKNRESPQNAIISDITAHSKTGNNYKSQNVLPTTPKSPVEERYVEAGNLPESLLLPNRLKISKRSVNDDIKRNEVEMKALLTNDIIKEGPIDVSDHDSSEGTFSSMLQETLTKAVTNKTGIERMLDLARQYQKTNPDSLEIFRTKHVKALKNRVKANHDGGEEENTAVEVTDDRYDSLEHPKNLTSINKTLSQASIQIDEKEHSLKRSNTSISKNQMSAFSDKIVSLDQPDISITSNEKLEQIPFNISIIEKDGIAIEHNENKVKADEKQKSDILSELMDKIKNFYESIKTSINKSLGKS